MHGGIQPSSAQRKEVEREEKEAKEEVLVEVSRGIVTNVAKRGTKLRNARRSARARKEVGHGQVNRHP